MKNFDVINEDKHTFPIIISIPHSGTYIPKDIRNKLIEDVILPNTDWFLKELYSFLKEEEITVIQNNISRYVIDVNRDANIVKAKNYRKDLVFSKTSKGKEIFKNSITRKDVERRINVYYKPYHDGIKSLIKEKLKYFKKVYIIDLHSYYTTPNGIIDKVLLGNQNGRTSSSESFDLICDTFLDKGLEVECNKEFLGGYITRYYGTKYGNKVESIQIELPYSKYIENRIFTEEVVSYYDKELFKEMQNNLKYIFKRLVLKLS